MLLLELSSLLVIILAILVVWQSWREKHWQRRGVTTLQSTFLLGSLADALRKRKAVPYVIRDLYNEARAKKLAFGGIFISTQPGILIIEPALVREIAIAQFDYFTDRRPFVEKGVDDLLSRSLLSLRGEEWRHMRHTLSPAFTGSKLRGMISLMESACRNLVTVLVSKSETDMREIYRKLATDIIATTAFGAPSDALLNPDSEFYSNGASLMDFRGKRKLVVAGYMLAPALMQLFRIPFLPKQLSDFFKLIIRDNIAIREQSHLSRPDMIQLLLDERRKGTISISDSDIASQAFTFFLGGFETVATAMSFAALELAVHPDIQQRLRVEIDKALEMGGGHLNYETVQGLVYLDMVISEVLRLHPIVPVIDRACTKPFSLPQFNLELKENDKVLLPFYAFHHDPQYFPNPEQFDPERFSEANRHDIQRFTYLPFGVGPRNCIGQRFALLEVKLAIAYTLAAVELHPGPDTQYPIVLDPKKLDNSPVGGFVLRTLARNDEARNPRI